MTSRDHAAPQHGRAVATGAASVDISVVICTHNPRADYLHRVLRALDAQTLRKDRWEVLLVDNASDTPLSKTYELSWHPRARHIREDELGLTPARLRGIRESSGETLVYVDDDNVLAPDYLEVANELLGKLPYLGVIGAGVLEPEFEVPPSPELIPYVTHLALRRVPEARWGNITHDRDSVPWGAGLCVRRTVAQAYLQLLQQLGIDQLLDRRGEHLFGNGDVAFSWSATLLGLGFGVFPSLRVTHLIGADRTTERYLLRLVRDSSFSAGVSDYLWTGVLPGEHHSRGERYIRLLLRCLKKGRFATRMSWAAHRGTDRAHAFIERHGLQPFARGCR
jgi:glycosyltransferase involved in cell wall biosynthesis